MLVKFSQSDISTQKELGKKKKTSIIIYTHK